MFQCNRYIGKDIPNECNGLGSKCIVLRSFRLGLESCKPMPKHLLQSATSVPTTGLSNATISDSQNGPWTRLFVHLQIE